MSGSVSQDIMKQMFRDGQTPFAITGPWNLTDFVDAGVNLAVEPVPPIAGNATRPFVGVQGFMISAFAKNTDLATSFLTECINNKEASLAFFEGQPGRRPGSTPTTRSSPIRTSRALVPPPSRAKRNRTSRRWAR